MSSAVSASAKGVSFLILIQVTSRALTFIVNQILLRYLSPELLGASTQLELYSISVLYFARESFRVALQRQAGNPQAVVNVSYIPICLGLPLTYLLAELYQRTSLPQVPHISTAIQLYGVASVIELLSEPCFVVVQQHLAYKVRAAAETGATFARCLTTFGVVFWAQKSGESFGVLPFAFGQLSYAVSLLAIYCYYTVPIAKSHSFVLGPRKMLSNEKTKYVLAYFSRPICVLASNMYLQSAVKYILTQGDSLLIATLTTLHDQGAYALASNYGGLIARMLFQPIEESSRNLFAKLCAPHDDTQKPTTGNLNQASATLLAILRFYSIISLVAWSLGPSIAPLLLRLVAGSKWADTGAGDVLATYCYYIPLLAMNGVTEAFVAAVASNADLKRQSALMVAYSIGFAGAAYVFLKVLGLGAEGLVWANCLNMLFRIVWNTLFIKEYFGRYQMTFSASSVLPTSLSIAASIATASIMYASGRSPPTTLLKQLMSNVGIAAAFVATLLGLERSFFFHCYRLMMPQKGTNTAVK